MRFGFLSAVLTVLIVGVAAFFGGEYWAKFEAKHQCDLAMSWESASQRAQALFIVRQALENLHDGKVVETNTVLVRYAKLHASALVDCSRSPQCSAWVGRFMPSQDEFLELASMKENP